VGRALIVVVLLGAAHAVAEEPRDARVEALERRVAELERMQHVNEPGDAHATIDARPAPLAPLASPIETGIPLGTASREATPLAPFASPMLIKLGGFRLVLSGFVQADGVLYNQASVDEVNPATGVPLNQTRFLIRRAHLRTDLDYGVVSGALELEASTVQGANVRLFAAEVSLRWPTATTVPYAMATIGLFRIPFGFENQERDYVRLFMERSSIIRALFPGENDLGVRVQGGWRAFRYQLAAMNGHPVAEQQYALLDPTRSKDFLGRLGVDTPLTRRVQAEVGLSALWGTGFHTGTPATKNGIAWNDSNGNGQVDPTEIIGIAGQPAVPSQTFTRYALGGDVRLVVAVPRLGALQLYGELVWATNLDRGLLPADPVGVGRDLRELGWYVGATQALTRWAALGIRYDRYDPDADAREQAGANLVARDRTFTTLAVVVAALYRQYGRVTLEYDHNTNGLLRDASGAPATLGSDVLTLRAQVVF
jgi:hypothetical protein